MSAFDRPKPQFSDEALADVAKTYFGVSGAIEHLESERDQNAVIRTGEGDYVLKIANAGEARASLDLQNAVLRHLEARAPALAAPRLLPSQSGAVMAEHAGPDGLHHVRLLTYVSGRPLADAPRFPELLENLGGFMGRLSLALQSFDHPAADRPDFLWALDNAAACRAYAEDIVEPEHRHRVERLFDRYDAEIAPRLNELRKSVTHQDANEHNIIVDGANASHVVGLIDFGDACRGAQANELAVTLAYALLGVDDVLGAAGQIIKGYASAFPLQCEEIAILFDLVSMRLAMSVCISSNRSKSNPDNPYLLISQAPAFELLRRLEALDRNGYARALFADAALAGAAAGGEDAGTAPDVAARRAAALNPALSVSYRRPLNITRGRGAYLYDNDGRRYLDCANNIAHVGHCHPHLVAAIARQASRLNANTRYLHETIVAYAERLAATLPGELSVVTFVNSGTEANELALRMARTATGRKATIVLDWAYHGNSAATVEVSPYKFKRRGGFEKPDFVEVAELPDGFRGPFKGMGAETGLAYARSVGDCVERIKARKGEGPACFIAESISGVGGQVCYPKGYLKSAYEAVRAAGGLCIADEVQCGFGRVGEAFWAFEQHGVAPDIVVLGKPMGGGHPLGAVVTTPDIASAFANGMEYFNSFGGNPVSMAAGMAVMDILEGEALAANARAVGAELVEALAEMAERYEIIGDVRGSGFFLGVELVEDRQSLTPASRAAGDIINVLRENGVLLSTDGPHENVLKFKPPMAFRRREAAFFCEQLEGALRAVS